MPGRDRMIFNHRSKEGLLAHKMVLQIAFLTEFSRPTSLLERYASNSSIPWNQPTIFHPGRIAKYRGSVCDAVRLGAMVCGRTMIPLEILTSFNKFQ